MPVRKRTYERNGKTWIRFVATVELAGSERKRRTKSFQREREAKAWESKVRAQIEDRATTGARTPRLSDHLDLWLERGKTSVRKPWKPSTVADYESTVKAHLKPRLGHLRLEDLTVDHVEALLNSIPGNRAVNVRIALSSALSMAVKQRLVPYNVAKSAESPPIERRSSGGLTTAEARTFLNAAQEHRLGPLFIVTTALALRQAEAIGLRWADLSLEGLTLKIDQTIYYKGGSYHTVAPKSPTSRRTVHFPEEIADVLREHRTRTLTYQLASSRWEDQGLVFPNMSGGPLYGPYVTRTMQRIMREAGIEGRRFHDLRHTGASMLHAMGVDMKTIQGVLGHSDYRLTADTYTHVEDSVMKDAADRMGKFLRG
jgi:integrase